MLKQVIAILKKKVVPWLVCIISLYALYLRLHNLSAHALWGDEYGTLVIMKGSFELGCSDIFNSYVALIG